MLAAYIDDFGPPSAIRLGRLPVPEPGPDQVLVRVEVVAVNHVDTLIRSGVYRTGVTLPFVVGRDLVGVVARTGPGVTAPPPGAPVWCNSLGYGGRQGSFAEYAVVPAERLYRLPDGVDPIAAVSVLHTGTTAHIGLCRVARLCPGETVVIGGGGGVASAATQFAAARGARVIAVDRAANAEFSRACGAAEFVDRADPELAGRLAALAPDGVDVYWDNSGRHDFAATVPLMARGGRILLSAGLVGGGPAGGGSAGGGPAGGGSAGGAAGLAGLPIGPFYTRDLSLLGFVVSNASVADLADAAAAINRALADGRLRGRVRATLPLTAAAEAHRLMEQHDPDAPPGRIVLTVAAG